MQVMMFKPVEKKKKAFLVKCMDARWHERLGHVNFEFLKNSIRNQAVFLGPHDKLEEDYKCDICIKAKATLKPYKTQSGTVLRSPTAY